MAKSAEAKTTRLVMANGVTVSVAAEKGERLLESQPATFFAEGSRDAKAAIDAQPAATPAAAALAGRTAQKAAGSSRKRAARSGDTSKAAKGANTTKSADATAAEAAANAS